MKRTYGTLAAVATLALGACASYVGDYQQRLIRTLPSQGEVTFSNSRTYPGQVLCGQYTSLTDQGFSFVTRDYVITPSLVMPRPQEDEKAVFCSEEAAAALYARHGIGGADADWALLARIRDDMRAIDAAISRYHVSTQAMPRRLADLLGGDYGIEAERLVDPWGRDYLYEEGLAGRTTPQYELRSLGADGASGGQGASADIRREQLVMLDHVLALQGL